MKVQWMLRGGGGEEEIEICALIEKKGPICRTIILVNCVVELNSTKNCRFLKTINSILNYAFLNKSTTVQLKRERKRKK